MTEPPRCRVCRAGITAGDDVVFPAAGGVVHSACHPREPSDAAVSPTCRLCLIPIGAGDLAFSEGATLVHVRYHERAYGGGALGEFLEAHPGWSFCHSCLASRLELRWDVVRKAVWTLRVSRGFQVRPGLCSLCNQARVVIGSVVGTRRNATV